jgi:hypothetical protein
MITKYGIADSNNYVFDETGFMMGIISIDIDVTSAERRYYEKLAQPGNREWTILVQSINSQDGGCHDSPLLQANITSPHDTRIAVYRRTGSSPCPKMVGGRTRWV